MSENIEIPNAIYLVPTPIGNLDDITLRAIKVLTNADIIACEDTRRTGQLLKLLGIRPKTLESYHEHNEAAKTEKLINSVLNGKSLALVSDAGSPTISDPGFRLVRAAIDNNITIVPLPGPTAFVPALSASGIAINEFIFLGFPPQKKGRKTFLIRLANYQQTVILYESPHRINKLVEELLVHCGANRPICIAREISKIYEEFIRGTIAEVKAILEQRQNLKGEIVVIIEGAPILSAQKYIPSEE